MPFQKIAEPFLFNPMKHHVRHIQSFIDRCKKQGIDKGMLHETLLKMGKCMLDLYIGKIEIAGITNEIQAILMKLNAFDNDSYIGYISKSQKCFQLIRLSDGSIWTLLLGFEADKYIHIHPARGSIHTIRVSAIALKTALILKAYYPDINECSDLVNTTNEIRTQFLDESPIKDFGSTKGIRNVLQYL